VHSPDQREGDFADLPLFPNPAHAQQVQEEQAESTRLEQELEEARRKEAEQQAAESGKTEKRPSSSNYDPTYYSPQRIAERASEAAKS
jgi:hypothetical protein